MAHNLTTAATSLTLTLLSLHPFYTYNCTLVAYTIAEGPCSVEVNITVPEDGTLLSALIIITAYIFCH